MPTEGQSDLAARNQAIQLEAQHSLFLDSIDPKFQPHPLAPNEAPLFTAQKNPQLGASRQPQADSLQDHPGVLNGLNAPLPTSIFQDTGENRPNDDYLYRRPTDSPYLTRQPGTFGYRQNDQFNERDQSSADRAEDFVFPGFGRIEGPGSHPDWRIDYVNVRSCHVKGLGLCFRMKLH